MEDRAFEFGLANFVLLVGFALFQGLADTENHLQTIFQSQLNLLFQNLRSLSIILSTFRMAQYNIFCTGAFHHFCRYFSRVSTFLFVSAVLCTEAYWLTVQQACNGCQVDKRSADNDVAVGLISRKSLVEFFNHCHTFLQVQVHFPVSCYNFLSHFSSFL